jgi:4-amino-4-deoxy-L-arabinose transferase-like glycosyltransferase
VSARLGERLRAAVAGASDARLGVALAALAFVVRLAYVLEIDRSEFAQCLVGDAATYDAWARAIAQGDWLGHEVFYQAPLYPYVVAVVYELTGPSFLAVRIVQAALGAAACVLLASAGRRFFSRATGLGAGLVLALYGPAIFFTGLVHKMTLDVFFTAALLYALARADAQAARRGPWLGVAGVAFGCLALTRENALAWLPVVIAWLAWRARAATITVRRPVARRIAPFLGGALLVLAPVAARNAAFGGVPLPTTSQLGVNFYLGNNADADGLYTPLRFGHGSFAQERQDAIEIAERARGRTLSPAEVSSYWFGRAWAWGSQHPGDWLSLLARKWVLVWSAREIADSDEPLVYEDASVVLRVTSLASFGWLAPLAAAGIVAGLCDRRRRPLAAAEVGLLALLLTSAASTAVFLVFARYRAPMLPILAVFAALGVGRLSTLSRERPARRWALGAACVAGALAAVVVRLPAAGDEHPRATARYNLAVTLEGQGQLARAAESYRAALREAPDFVEARVNLGSLLARGGDYEAAIVEERAVLRAVPDDPTAHTILANALLETGRLAEAEVHYRAALVVDAKFPSALAGLEAVRARAEAAPAP